MINLFYITSIVLSMFKLLCFEDGHSPCNESGERPTFLIILMVLKTKYMTKIVMVIKGAICIIWRVDKPVETC